MELKRIVTLEASESIVNSNFDCVTRIKFALEIVIRNSLEVYIKQISNASCLVLCKNVE